MKRFLGILMAVLMAVTMLAGGALAAPRVLTLPQSLEIIGEEAFEGLSRVDEVRLPEGIIRIDSRAFADSSLRRVNLPDSLQTIAPDAFRHSGLTTVVAEPDTAGYSWAKARGYEVLSRTPDNRTFRTFINNGTTVTLIWAETLDAESYEVECSRDQNFDVLEGSEQVVDARCTFYALQSDIDYWFRVSALDIDGNVLGVSQAEKVTTETVKVEVPIEELYFSDELYVGSVGAEDDSLSETRVVVPDDATKQSIRWESSNPAVAAVDPDTGVVTGLSVGTAVITVTAQDGSGASDYVEYFVTPQAPAGLMAGKSGNAVTASWNAVTGAGGYEVTCFSEAFDDWIVREIPGGNTRSCTIAGLRPNTAYTVTVRTGYDFGDGFLRYGCESDSVQVVTGAASGAIQVRGIEIYGDELRLEPGSMYDLLPDVQILPGYATDSTLTWTSSDAAIAAVDAQTGVVTAVSPGDAVITARAVDGSGMQDSIGVMVRPRPDIENVALYAQDDGEALIYDGIRDFVRTGGDLTIRLSQDAASHTGQGGGLHVLVCGTEGRPDLTNAADDPTMVGYSLNDMTLTNEGIAQILEGGGVLRTFTQAELADYNYLKIMVGGYFDGEDHEPYVWAGTALHLCDQPHALPAISSTSTSNGTNITVKWGSVPETEYYRVSYSKDGFAGDIRTVETSGTQVTLHGLEPSTTYSIFVTAYDKETGLGYSGSTVTRKTGSITTPVAVTGLSFANAAGEAEAFPAAVGQTNAAAADALVIEPENASNYGLHWQSQDPGVATVDPDTGAVTGVSVGRTWIEVSSVSNPEVSAVYRCDVGPRAPQYAYHTENANSITVFWEDVEDADYYTVSCEGVYIDDFVCAGYVPETRYTLRGLSPYEMYRVWVTPVANYGEDEVLPGAPGTALEAWTQEAVPGIPVREIAFDLESSAVTLKPGEEFDAGGCAVVRPNYAGNKGLTWSSSDPSVATVDGENGVISAHGYGCATITATAQSSDSVFAELQVTVAQDPPVITNLSFSGDQRVQAAWTAVDDASQYDVLCWTLDWSLAKILQDDSLYDVVTVDGSTLSCAMDGMAGNDYRVCVRAMVGGSVPVYSDVWPLTRR